MGDGERTSAILPRMVRKRLLSASAFFLRREWPEEEGVGGVRAGWRSGTPSSALASRSRRTADRVVGVLTCLSSLESSLDQAQGHAGRDYRRGVGQPAGERRCSSRACRDKSGSEAEWKETCRHSRGDQLLTCGRREIRQSGGGERGTASDCSHCWARGFAARA